MSTNKLKLLLSAFTIFTFSAFACSASAEPDHAKLKPNLFAKDNLVAWCIVPYDNQERTPAGRAAMLQELGIRSLAWDWRQKHLGSLEEEIGCLKQANIELAAVWCWIDGNSSETPGESNETLLATLKRTGTKTEIWMSFASSFFSGLSDEQKVAKGAEAVAILREKAKAIGCSVCLYNHGDWFGEPRNMIRIIRHLEVDDIGLVYNFHHAHDQLKEYEANLALMMPYLRTVNLNGMRADGPKIIPLGSGDREEVMMKKLQETGFQGRIGILGHVENADVKDVLAENLAGMKKLLGRMGESEALATY